MKYIDDILNKVTMYRLVVYGLAAMIGIAIMYAFLGKLSYEPTDMIMSLAVITVTAYAANFVLGRIWKVPTNSETWLITTLILFLILPPATTLQGVLSLAVAGIVSSASKFVLAIRGKHIFNPAAFAAAFLSLSAIHPASWWIGSSALWPFSLIVGMAVVRKIRRFPLVATFVVVAVLLQIIIVIIDGQHMDSVLRNALVASPLIFLSTIMLTEPATMPPRRNQQVIFGALVAALYVFAWKIGPLYIYPEVALLLGNIYAYVVSPKARVRLTLKQIQKYSDHVYDYIFTPDRPFRFLPGQYMEWTLAGVPFDSRGNRRTFTIASSPTEQDVHVGLKYYEPSSAYKDTFKLLQPGDTVYASQIAGNFTLQGVERKKLAFVAGGIGITPFRSMLKYITDKNLRCDIVLLYIVADPQEFAYVSTINDAAKQGVRVLPMVTQDGYVRDGVISGKLNADTIARHIPDYAERTFYVSGPNGMVDASKRYLRELQIARGRIITDHFSGY